jgi:NADPH:quinone reductase-like Zn-dependent oxidoreductase
MRQRRCNLVHLRQQSDGAHVQRSAVFGEPKRAAVAFDQIEVLVGVKAVAINPLDWKIFEGQMKFVTGSKYPRGVGVEFSGVIAAAGSAVKNFRVGDEVFGMLDAFNSAVRVQVGLRACQNLRHSGKGGVFRSLSAGRSPSSSVGRLECREDVGSLVVADAKR